MYSSRIVIGEFMFLDSELFSNPQSSLIVMDKFKISKIIGCIPFIFAISY